jgi:subtilase family serine protease
MRARSFSTALLGILLVLPASLSLGGAAASHDASAPLVTGWGFNAPVYRPGDNATFSFNVSDESGIRSVYFSLRHEGGQANYTFGFVDENRTSGMHNASFTWHDDVRGNYTMAYYYAEDVFGNRRYVYPDGFPNGSLRTVVLGPSQVDVHLRSLSGPSTATAGETVHYQASVQNMGDAEVGPFQAAWWINGAKLRTESLPGLASGAVAWTTFNWTPVPGEHEIRVVADSTDAIAEDDETDNEQSRILLVSGNASSPPDLLVASLQAFPSSPQGGEPVFVNATVHNAGTTAAGFFQVAFRVDGGLRGLANVSGLAGGASTPVGFWWTAAPGDHHLAVYADSAGYVNESDEGNNGANVTVSVGSPLVDLVILSLSAPSNATAGSAIPVSAMVGNKGNDSAGPFYVGLLVDGDPVAWRFLPGLGAGANVNVSFHWNATSGTHTLTVVADIFNEVPETNEGNNAANATVSAVRPQVDLSVLSFSAPSDATEGDLVSVSATAWNNGNAPASGFYVVLLVDGNPVWWHYQDGLDAGATADFTFLWNATPGTHTLAVALDYYDWVPEVDEGNNVAAQAIHVRALPPADLAVDILDSSRTWLRTDLGPLAPNPLHDRLVTVEVVNHGEGDARSASVALWAEAVGGTPLGNGSRVLVGVISLGDLPAGASKVVTFTWDPKGFVGDVDLKASVWNWRGEADFSDNEDVYRDFVFVGGTGFGIKL